MYPQPVTVTITQIEAAINHWRDRRPTADAQSPALCAEARALADVYGLLIFRGATSIEFSTLNTEQREALAAVMR
jgi:hypothetical protein